MSKWIETTIGDQITLQRGFDITKEQQKQGNIPVVSSGGISSFHNEYKIIGPGVVIGRKGTLGKTFYLSGKFWPHDTTLWVKDFHGNHPKFVYYFFKWLKVGFLDVGSANPTLNRNHLHPLKVFWPPLPIQKRIAEILGRLDDKIELNRRINAALEEMAQRLYKHWFVDFAPFQEGEFVESELGLIPQGWRVGTLGDVATVTKGISYRSVDLVDEADTALVSLKCFGRNGEYQESGLKPYIGKYKPEQIVKPGEIAVAQTDLTQNADVVGRTIRIKSHPNISTLIASLDLAIVRPKSDNLSTEFLYSLLSRNDFHLHAQAWSNGTTVLHLNAKALPVYKFVMPPETVIKEFTKLIRLYHQNIDNNEKESRQLATIRDYLLPRLLSGELSVKETANVP